MSQIQELKARLPIAQIARQAGVDRADAERALDAVLPALLGGMRANAEDPRGAASLEAALAQHHGALDARLGDGDDLDGVDTADGERIVQHVFGPQTDQVVSALGGAGGGALGDVVRRILPIVAPIVLAWLAERLFSRGGASAQAPGGAASRDQAPQRSGANPFANGDGGAGRGSLPTPSSAGRRQEQHRQEPSSSGGGLGDLLGGILGGGRGGAGGTGGGGGDVLGDLLGGLLGGGRR